MKKRVFSVLLLFLLVLSVYIVYAGLDYVNVISPASNDNVSGVIILNVTVPISGTLNATFQFYDSTTGVFVFNATIVNTTADEVVFDNITFNTALITDGIYNLTVQVFNSTVNITNTSVTEITIDNTAPTVTTINTPVEGANLTTGTQVFNATVTDATIGIDYVVFNISNGSSFLLYQAISPSDDFWNVSVPLSDLDEGSHTATVRANDTLNNINITESVTFTVDRAAPTVTLVNTSFTTTTDNSPSITFNFTDTVSPTASCNLYFNNTGYNLTNSVLNGTNTVITPNVSLSNGNYSVQINCTDVVSNVGVSNIINVVVNSPRVTAFNSPPSADIFNKVDFVLNVTVTGSPATVQYRILNGSNISIIVVNWTTMQNLVGDFWNATINISALEEWNYTIRINATDALGNSNTTETIVSSVDTTNPSSTYTCSDVVQSASQSCTCTSTDNSESYGGSVTNSETSIGTGTTGAKISTCTATDSAGNTAATNAAFTVTVPSGTGGSGLGGSGGGISLNVGGSYEKKLWTNIVGGETATVNIADEDIGITKVEFDVGEDIYNVWVKVAKRDFLPSNIPDNDERTYQYLEITKSTSVKDDNIRNTNVDFKVKKSWLTENNLQKEGISLYRYNNDVWNELTTTISGEDDSDVFYFTPIPGFSFFAIGESTIEVTPTEEVVEETVPEETVSEPEQPVEKPTPTKETTPDKTVDTSESEDNNTILYVVLAVLVIIILAAIIIYMVKSQSTDVVEETKDNDKNKDK